MEKKNKSYLFQNIDEIKDVPKFELRKIILRSIVEYMDYEARMIPIAPYIKHIIKDIEDVSKEDNWIKGFESIEGTINYLIDKEFINHPDTDTYTLMAKGIDEVENDFPILDPPIDTSTSVINFLYEDLDEVIKKIDEVKLWKTNIENIERDIQIIKFKLESTKSEIKEEEILDLINELSKTSDLIKALFIIYRILNHAKVTDKVKQLIAPGKKLLLPVGYKL